MEQLLTLLILSPLLGVIPLGIIPSRFASAIRFSVLTCSFIPFLISLYLFMHLDAGGTLEFVEKMPWIPSFHINYHLGVDGISLPLILLTTFLLPIVILSIWKDIRKNLKSFLLFLLLLEVGVLGTFCAIDLILFYVFWEVMLLPMYFLIGLWGGSERIYASMKFVLYTMFGSLLMLGAILYLYFAGNHSFDITVLYQLELKKDIQLWLFSAFALAFAIKVPLFPLHTWLPDAHVQAPTAGSVLLAGVLLKMGTYGFIRFAIPLFPEAFEIFRIPLMWMCVIGVLYGALVAMVQTDIKKLVAYSSVSHMGYVMLGIFSLAPESLMGANLQMLNHGISTAGLFLLVGMLYERRHTRLISDFGGIAHVMPLYTVLFLIVGFSSIAVPGTNGFVGEFLILLGSFSKTPLLTTLAASGVVFSAVYMLWAIQRIFFGKLSHDENRTLKDIDGREILLMLPLLTLIFWIGVKPDFLTSKMQGAINQFLTLTQPTETLKEKLP